MTRPGDGGGGTAWDFVVTAICLGALAGALVFTPVPVPVPEWLRRTEAEGEVVEEESEGDAAALTAWPPS